MRERGVQIESWGPFAEAATTSSPTPHGVHKRGCATDVLDLQEDRVKQPTLPSLPSLACN
jgi:hypothetical protein